MAGRWISASEVGQFVYCRRAWGYARRGLASVNWHVMDTGRAEHQRLARNIAVGSVLRVIGALCLLAALGLLVAMLAYA